MRFSRASGVLTRTMRSSPREQGAAHPMSERPPARRTEASFRCGNTRTWLQLSSSTTVTQPASRQTENQRHAPDGQGRRGFVDQEQGWRCQLVQNVSHGVKPSRSHVVGLFRWSGNALGNRGQLDSFPALNAGDPSQRRVRHPQHGRGAEAEVKPGLLDHALRKLSVQREGYVLDQRHPSERTGSAAGRRHHSDDGRASDHAIRRRGPTPAKLVTARSPAFEPPPYPLDVARPPHHGAGSRCGLPGQVAGRAPT